LKWQANFGASVRITNDYFLIMVWRPPGSMMALRLEIEIIDIGAPIQSSDTDPAD